MIGMNIECNKDKHRLGLPIDGDREKDSNSEETFEFMKFSSVFFVENKCNREYRDECELIRESRFDAFLLSMQ